MSDIQGLETGHLDAAGGEDLSKKYLTFKVGGQMYGISISNVIEIVKIQEATSMPELPYYAKGIINLRGRVVPLIDVNLRFGKAEQEYTDRTCIIIVDIDNVHVGFIVDAVDEVLDINDDKISQPPSLSSDASSRFVVGVGRMEKCIVLLLNSRMLVSDEMMMGV